MVEEDFGHWRHGDTRISLISINGIGEIRWRCEAYHDKSDDIAKAFGAVKFYE